MGRKILKKKKKKYKKIMPTLKQPTGEVGRDRWIKILVNDYFFITYSPPDIV